MKLDLTVSTILACLVALRVRAAEQQALGYYDSKSLRAYQELQRAAQECQLAEFAADLAKEVL